MSPMSVLTRGVAVLGLAGALLAPARAGIFDDDEARKAILDLRQKLEQSNEAQRVRQAELNAQMADVVGDYAALGAITEKLGTLNAEREELELEWLEAAALLD